MDHSIHEHRGNDVDYAAEVVKVYPKAVSVPAPYHRWLIMMDPMMSFTLGGGPTKEEAWKNAYIQLGRPIL